MIRGALHYSRRSIFFVIGNGKYKIHITFLEVHTSMCNGLLNSNDNILIRLWIKLKVNDEQSNTTQQTIATSLLWLFRTLLAGLYTAL